MKHSFLRWFTFFFSVFFLFQMNMAAAEVDIVKDVLQTIEFSKEMCVVNEEAIQKTYGDDPFRLPFFNEQLQNPLQTPSVLKNNVDYCITHRNSLRNIHWYASYRLGYMVAAYPQYEPTYEHRIVESAPLLYAISDIYLLHKKPLSSYAFAALKTQTEEIPLDLQRAIANVLFASMEFKLARDKAFFNIPTEHLIQAFQNPAAILTEDTLDETIFQIASDVNYGQLYFASIVLSHHLDAFLQALSDSNIPDSLSFSTNTPMGHILIHPTKDTLHTYRNVLFSLDLGGNDHYMNSAGGNDSWFNPVSICIDMNGNDQYSMEDPSVYSQGAGVFGFGALIDFQGDDMYQSKQYSQGFGCFGVGLLWDQNGTDQYSCDYLAQGSGVFGIGILHDTSANDTYHTYSFGQGFGYVKGFGLLLDDAGDDVYIANDEDVAGTNPQSSDHNTSFCQGAGFGRRADLSEGNSMSGGMGVLIDIEGNDTYSCGVFGQGTGYWAGTGVLYDGKGNDSYKGVWYVQGGAAHFGIAMLMDDEGDDTYDALLNMAQGAGHDVSLGYLIDRSGNDTYTAPNLALGGGNTNGLGFFVDAQGDDVYQLRRNNATNLGKASCEVFPNTSWRFGKLTLGLFIDRSGEDTYVSMDEEGLFTIPYERAGNEKSWSFVHDKIANTVGCGIDISSGDIDGLLPSLPSTD
ncbi:MAG: hypothetical protein PHX86_06310 [Caldisericia bacterium]|nr:hypothetical protein [Caldisericia bacterium]